MKPLRWCVTAVWFGLGLYVGLMFLQGPLAQSWSAAHDFASWLSFAKVFLGFLLVELLFVAAYLAAGLPSLLGAAPPEQTAAPRVGFPMRPTVAVGIWLLLLIVLLVAGLLVVLGTDPTAAKEAGGLRGWIAQPEVKALLVTMMAAGIGSLITAILGYVEHASERADFQLAFAPWYVARPVMGTLLGMVFYFVIRGGLFAVVNKGTPLTANDLSEWTLAGLGALVGMFSKDAIDKLQEIFETLFAGKSPPNGQTGGGGQAGAGAQDAADSASGAKKSDYE